MRRSILKFISALSLALILLAGCARMNTQGTAFMWEVTDEGGRLYLLGSIHAAKDELYPLKPVIMDAFEGSDVLAVECDVTAAVKRPDYLELMKKVMYRDNTTIKDHIPEDLYDKADTILKKNGMSIGLFAKYKPFMLASIITSYQLSEWGYNPNNGIDVHLIGLARETGKEIAEIESIDFQYEMIGGFSDEIQVLELRGTLEGIESSKLFMDDMFRIWKDGDVKGFEKLIFQEDGTLTPHERDIYSEYEKQMIDDRNINMALKAEEYLDSGRTYFFVAGCGHMVGDTGIVTLLRNKGYKVIQK